MYDPQSSYYKPKYVHGHYNKSLTDEISDAIEVQQEKMEALDDGQNVDENMNDDSSRLA